MYEVIFYTSERGDSPIDEFLDDLNTKHRGKVAAWIDLLEQEGPNLKRPYADIVRGKIRELRVKFGNNQYRILYFFYLRNKIVLVHGFVKKSDSIDEKDINVAERRREDWIKRSPKEIT